MYDAQIFLVGFMQVLNYILYTSILIYVVNPPQSEAHLIRIFMCYQTAGLGFATCI